MRLTAISMKLVIALATLGSGFGSASAQTVPWDLFVDDRSSSACEVVNAANAELVVLSDTGQLVIVSGEDVILVDTFVDLDGSVFFEGSAAGVIDFAEDDDGFRTLWWMSLTGLAVAIDDFTGVPIVSDLFPGDFANVDCDACPLWDDPSVCVEPDDPIVIPPITINLCGASSQLSLGLTAVGLSFMGLLRRRSM